MPTRGNGRSAGYLGRVLNGMEPVGTCFQVEPGLLVTAWHVLVDAGAGEVGGSVLVDGLKDPHDPPSAAEVVKVDPEHDLAVLRRPAPLPDSVSELVLSAGVNAGDAVLVTGYAVVPDVNMPDRSYRFLDADGMWAGGAMRNNTVALGRVSSAAVLRGMSGAPVCLASGDGVVGVVSERYNSADGWLRDSVWVARTEDLVPLLAGLSTIEVTAAPPMDAGRRNPEIHVELIPPVLANGIVPGQPLEVIPGQPVLFVVELTNHGNRLRRLIPKVPGQLHEVSSFKSSVVPIAPGKTERVELVLTCTSNLPEAGSRFISVLATDEDKNEYGASNAREISVSPAPRLVLAIEKSERTDRKTIWRVMVSVSNEGNTTERGKIYPKDSASISEHPPLGNRTRLLGEGTVRSESFRITPGAGTRHVTLTVTLPDQAWRSRRWWTVLIPYGLDELDRRKSIPSDGALLRIEQPGILSELSAYTRAMLGRGLRRAARWSRQPVTVARGLVAAALVATSALVLTMLMWRGVQATEKRPLTGAAITTVSSRTPSTPFPTELDVKTSYIFSRMDCRKGEYVARFGKFDATGDFDNLLRRKLEIELRAQQRGMLLELNVSREREACPGLPWPDERGQGWIFLYAGPVASQQQANAICDGLALQSANCTLRPVEAER
jgi:Trypsin-like peptidase domain